MPERAAALLDAQGRVVQSGAGAPVAWWSFTKTLIAALAVRLATERAIDLDAPMVDPRYSLRDVLSNRAGLPDYGELAAYHRAVAADEAPWSDEELLTRTSACDLLFAPRTSWSYSNVGYLLARRHIEAASGQRLADLLSRRFFEPLALAHSRLAATRADMAGLLHPPPHPYDPGWVFHGLVIGPASEAALCLHALMAGGSLSDDERDQLLLRHPIGGAVEGRPWITTGYGLGLMMGEMQAANGARVTAIGHSAGGPGSRGAVYHFVQNGRRTTAAMFGPFGSEGAAEHEALAMAVA